MKLHKTIKNSVLLFIGIVELSNAGETICYYKKVRSEIKIINLGKEDKRILTIYIIDKKNGTQTVMNNAGLIMGCVVEGLALSDVDQSLVVDNQITIKFKNKGSEIIIENFSDNGIITVNLTRLEAIEMVRVISKYYGFSVKLTANERGQ